MKYKNFEDFLQWEHAKEYVGLDDEMPDAFNEWLGAIDIDDWIKYGDEYAKTVLVHIGSPCDIGGKSFKEEDV